MHFPHRQKQERTEIQSAPSMTAPFGESPTVARRVFPNAHSGGSVRIAGLEQRQTQQDSFRFHQVGVGVQNAHRSDEFF